ncbi:hypothetical protein [uncultured Bacteroides sp.]|jgi:hypothetical protein|uniref:hypothetical protein n=1 Tax=uncultured Bacteroides sp. TaxID=162156 RepID=UPI0026204DDF|nr:hypothetical protein [uncultured Bacteroides sp.]
MKICNTKKSVLRYGIFIFLSVLINSCENFDDPKDIHFDISINNILETDFETGAYVVNSSDDIEFLFHGDIVDNITFYSGAIGEEARYKNRWIADKEANIKPLVRLKTSAFNLKDLATTSKFELLIAYDEDIPDEYTDKAIAETPWEHFPLRTSNLTSGSGITEYFNFNDKLVTSNGTHDYTNWFSHKEVVYGIRAKSNVASTNRLQLNEFYVSNTETRDYSYTYQGKNVKNTKTKEYVIFKDFSIIDQNLRISNSLTGANWGMYTPLETIKEGEESTQPNSQHYAWNCAEFGLKYGELTGSYPWTTTNKFGQDIRSAYSVEIFVPTKNIQDPNGNPLSEPTEEMMNEPYESWIVSSKHNIHKVMPDVPSSYIKVKSQGSTNSFIYSYSKIGKGLYTATFIINNQTHAGTKEIVKEFKFLVK